MPLPAALGDAIVRPQPQRETRIMAVRIGYLLPTREQVMEGRPEAAPLLALAERAEGLGYDSIWVGDSITGPAAARAADPAVGGCRAHPSRRTGHRGAAAGTAQPGRAGARHRDSGPDQRRPLHSRRRHRQRRAEHPRRVRRLRRAVRKARRTHARRAAPLPRAVDRQAGLVERPLGCRAGDARPGAAPSRRTADLDRRHGAREPRTGRQAL